jgi:hypothetical protein
MNMRGQNAIINAMSVNQENVLVSGGDEGSLHFWDWKTASPPLSIFVSEFPCCFSLPRWGQMPQIRPVQDSDLTGSWAGCLRGRGTTSSRPRRSRSQGPWSRRQCVPVSLLLYTSRRDRAHAAREHAHHPCDGDGLLCCAWVG